MPYFRKIKAGLVKKDINIHVGEEGTLFFDVETGAFRLSDGDTPGGIMLDSFGLTAANIGTDPAFPENSDIIVPSQKAVKTALTTKQDTLSSGVNIKTINGNSLIGAGNLSISIPLPTRSGIVLVNAFSGNPKRAVVVFTTPMLSANYSISISSSNSRFWTFEDKTELGFTINANANAALTSDVTYIAVSNGEI